MKKIGKLKQNKGITLISLIITIIILLILAAVTIIELRNAKLLDKTTETKSKYKQAEISENDTLNDYANKINEISNGIVTAKKDSIPPEVTLTQEKLTSKSINVIATAKDEQSGMPEEPIYVFYLNGTQVQSGKSATYNTTELQPSTNYTIKVEVKDQAGNIGSKEINFTTKIGILYLYNSGEINSSIEDIDVITYKSLYSQGYFYKRSNYLEIVKGVDAYGGVSNTANWSDFFIGSTKPIDMSDYTKLNFEGKLSLHSSNGYSTVGISTMKFGISDSRTADHSFVMNGEFTSPNTQNGSTTFEGVQTIDISNNNLKNGYFKISCFSGFYMLQRTDAIINKIWLSE